MLIGINYGPSLTAQSSLDFIKEARDTGDFGFGQTLVSATTDGTMTAVIPAGQAYELVFTTANGLYAIEVGEEGGTSFTQFPVISKSGGEIRLKSLTGAHGELGKLIMPDRSVTIGYRVRLVDPVSSNKDDVLNFDGDREDLTMGDIVAGRTLSFVHTTAKLSPAAAIIGRINLVLPDGANSVLSDWHA